MTAKRRARIHRLRGGHVFLETPYDPMFLEQIKALVPKGARRFMEPPEGPAKGWRVSADWADVGEHLTRSAFPGAIDEIDEDGEVITRTADGRRLVQESLL